MYMHRIVFDARPQCGMVQGPRKMPFGNSGPSFLQGHWSTDSSSGRKVLLPHNAPNISHDFRKGSARSERHRSKLENKYKWGQGMPFLPVPYVYGAKQKHNKTKSESGIPKKGEANSSFNIPRGVKYVGRGGGV
jgi:hypothetical protein